MNRPSALALLACCTICVAQNPHVRKGANVYIEGMGGYETYLAAAFTKEHVPLIVVADKDKAEYVITSTVAHQDLAGGQPAVVVNNSNTAAANSNVNGNTSFNQGFAAAQQRSAERAAERRALGETSVSISVIDPRTSQVVFAYAAGKMGTNQLQKTAEDCASHLKKFIEKQEKQRR